MTSKSYLKGGTEVVSSSGKGKGKKKKKLGFLGLWSSNQDRREQPQKIITSSKLPPAMLASRGPPPTHIATISASGLPGLPTAHTQRIKD